MGGSCGLNRTTAIWATKRRTRSGRTRARRHCETPVQHLRRPPALGDAPDRVEVLRPVRSRTGSEGRPAVPPDLPQHPDDPAQLPLARRVGLRARLRASRAGITSRRRSSTAVGADRPRSNHGPERVLLARVAPVQGAQAPLAHVRRRRSGGTSRRRLPRPGRGRTRAVPVSTRIARVDLPPNSGRPRHLARQQSVVNAVHLHRRHR